MDLNQYCRVITLPKWIRIQTILLLRTSCSLCCSYSIGLGTSDALPNHTLLCISAMAIYCIHHRFGIAFCCDFFVDTISMYLFLMVHYWFAYNQQCCLCDPDRPRIKIKQYQVPPKCNKMRTEEIFVCIVQWVSFESTHQRNHLGIERYLVYFVTIIQRLHMCYQF